MKGKRPFFNTPHGKGILSVCAFLICVLVLVPYLMARVVSQTASRSDMLVYWFDVGSGNWSAARHVVNDWTFWATAIFAVLLNNSVIIIVLGFVYRFFTQRRDQMVRLKQVLALRDTMSKAALFSTLNLKDDPETTEKINSVFLSIDEKWIEYMDKLLSKEDVLRMKQKLEETL